METGMQDVCVGVYVVTVSGWVGEGVWVWVRSVGVGEECGCG